MIFLLPLFPPSLGLASFPGRLMGSVPQTRSTALTQTQESWCLQRGISVGRGSRVWLWERWGARREGPVNVVRTGAGDALWTRWEGLPGRRDSRPQSTHTPAAESCQTVACFVGAEGDEAGEAGSRTGRARGAGPSISGRRELWKDLELGRASVTFSPLATQGKVSGRREKKRRQLGKQGGPSGFPACTRRVAWGIREFLESSRQGRSLEAEEPGTGSSWSPV